MLTQHCIVLHLKEDTLTVPLPLSIYWGGYTMTYRVAQARCRKLQFVTAATEATADLTVPLKRNLLRLGRIHQMMYPARLARDRLSVGL